MDDFAYKKKWVKSIKGDWYSYQIPISFGEEISIVSFLKDADPKTYFDAVTECVAMILDIPPDVVEEAFHADQVSSIFNDIVPKVREEEVLQQENRANKESIDTIHGLLTFLSFHGRMQPSEIFRLPRAAIIQIVKEVGKLLDSEKEFQFEVSTVNALSMAFGGSKNKSGSSGFSSSKEGDNVIDLGSLANAGSLAGITKIPGIKVE